jgi:hypothetical protein
MVIPGINGSPGKGFVAAEIRRDLTAVKISQNGLS